MSDPKIVASGRKQVRRGSMSPDSSRSWLILGWIGLVFLVVGGSDFLLAWIPPNFGVPEWEFGTVSQSFNGLPILLLGLGFLTVASEEGDRRWWRALAGAGAVGLLVWVLVGALLWVRHVPLALETAPSELLLTMQRSVAKTAVQAVAYSAVLVLLVWKVWVAASAKSAHGDDWNEGPT